MAKPTWISVSPTSGNGNKNVNLTATINTSNNARSGSVSVSGKSISKSVSITQLGTPLTKVNLLDYSNNMGIVSGIDKGGYERGHHFIVQVNQVSGYNFQLDVYFDKQVTKVINGQGQGNLIGSKNGNGLHIQGDVYDSDNVSIGVYFNDEEIIFLSFNVIILS